MKRSIAIMICLACFSRAHAQDGPVELRPVDRATVRIVAFQGLASGTDDRGQTRVGLRLAHGSGVIVDRQGWIATAAHVVQGSEYLVVVLPGGNRGMPARIVYESDEHDVAILRVGAPLRNVLGFSRSRRLNLGQLVHASGYPLDPRERWPAAVSGQIGRPLNDGRVQLSLSVNPGNSGGPVVTADGALVGIVTQGADPQHGAQGIAIMEPIAAIADALAPLLREGRTAPFAQSVACDLVLEHIDARPSPPLAERLARLRTDTVEDMASAAILAVEAIELRRDLIEEHGSLDRLDTETRQAYDDAASIALRWAEYARRADPNAPRYAALGMLRSLVETAPAPMIAATAAPNTIATQEEGSIEGPATGPSPWAPRATYEEEYPALITFAVSGWGAFHFDDLENASLLGGGEAGAFAMVRFASYHYVYFRMKLELGAELAIGGWRESVQGLVLGSAGLRFEVGPEEAAVYAELAYTPGYIAAEGREHAVYAAYRASVGMSFGMFEIGVSWRELGRGADSTLRTLLVTAGVELGE